MTAFASAALQGRNLSDVLKSLALSLARMALSAALRPLGAMLGGLTANATGNVFANGRVVPFADGGVVNSPTLFAMRGGAGLMGEAGPEAIMPLKRGANGSLGVVAQGGGGVQNITVNVSTQGNSQVNGDQGKAANLGQVIAQAVQKEIVNQKRPGGLLAA